MPIAGTLIWLILAFTGGFLDKQWASLVMFIGTGSIVYLGMAVSKLTGENFLANGFDNEFDKMFMVAIVQSLFVFSIAIPFFLVMTDSLPLTVGILTGLMWLPLSWAIKHWVGIFHCVTRTAAILIVWYAIPEHRFVTIPLVIVAVYSVTIVILEKRWRAVNNV